MGDGVLLVRKVSKGFGKRLVIKDLSLEVERGELLGLIGSSGSGKTTLLKTIIGFYRPETGDVRFYSKKHQRMISVFSSPNFAKRRFGFASQEPSFYENLTVKENLEYFGSLYNLQPGYIRQRVEALLGLMELKSAAGTLGGKLSGGMERRLDIACSMIHNPEILILDEPTGDLDPRLRSQIWSIVRKINAKGTTVLLASHHLAEVESFCTRVAILKGGSLASVETPASLRARHDTGSEIIVESYPGDLKAISSLIGELKARSSHGRIVVSSPNPKDDIRIVLSALDECGEEVIDIRVSKPGLDELFERFSRG